MGNTFTEEHNAQEILNSEVVNEYDKLYAEKMYYELRNEIQEKVKRIEKQSNFVITTTTGFIGVCFPFLFGSGEVLNPTIIMLPFFFITPVYIRIAVTRNDIRKISDYMIEIYEKNISEKAGWEEYNRDNSRKLNKWFNYKYLDGMFSYLACLIIFGYACYCNAYFPIIGVIIAIVAVVLIIIPITEYLVTASTSKNR